MFRGRTQRRRSSGYVETCVLMRVIQGRIQGWVLIQTRLLWPWGRSLAKICRGAEAAMVAVPDPVRTLPRCEFIQFLWVMVDACDALRISSFPLIPPENGPAP